MSSALIGHTGFVGGGLLRQRAFDDTYNSTNIETIRGRTYAVVVCAGAPGRKWEANAHPDRDRASLERLMSALTGVSAGRFVLISTVDVYPKPVEVDEDSAIDEQSATAYGRHRRALERFVENRFDACIVRLPGLFGVGLKKNVIFDFLHNNQLNSISPDSRFQFYDLANLSGDIARFQNAGLGLVNVATEPISVRTIAEQVFGRRFENPEAPPPVSYDFHTRHAVRLGARNPYLYRADEVLEAMTHFVRSETSR